MGFTYDFYHIIHKIYPYDLDIFLIDIANLPI